MAESEGDNPGPTVGIAARLRATIGQPQVSEPYLRFRLDLLAGQQDARRVLRLLAASRAGSAPPARLPVGVADVAFPADVLGRLLRTVRNAAATHGRETEDIRRLCGEAAAEPAALPALAAAAAFGPDLEALESLARRWRVYLDALLFVGRVLAAPCVAEAVHGCAPASGEVAGSAEAHRCPACASPPSVARLRRADGRRVLTCGLCGTEWEMVRLACAWCGVSDREALGTLRLDDAGARWIETCERCKGYIKTVDERRLPEGEAVCAVVEEAATLHLDLLAEREGYIRRVPYVLSG
jgi:FdhE protein